MPKIIENLKDRLIAEAQKQIEESGYGTVTIRSVAKACGVGVGTVYNYFPSKEMLIATHLLEDGVDIRYIQTLLGHRSPRSTEVYLHVSNKALLGVQSPFDKRAGVSNE